MHLQVHKQKHTLPLRLGTVLGCTSLRRLQLSKGRVRAATQVLSLGLGWCLVLLSDTLERRDNQSLLLHTRKEQVSALFS